MMAMLRQGNFFASYCFLQLDWKQKKLVYFILMTSINQQELKSLVKKQVKLLVSEYLDSLTVSLITKRMNSHRNQPALDQFQDEKQEATLEVGSQLIAKSSLVCEKQSDFSRKNKNLEKTNLINISQIEKETQFFANFEEKHSTIQLQSSRIEIGHYNSFNSGVNALSRKMGTSRLQGNENTESKLAKVMKNIRVHNNRGNNKSTQHLHRETISKEQRYNELRDKTLVQYFYPKQKKLFRENVVNNHVVSNKENQKSTEKVAQSKYVKKCESQRKENVTIFLKKRKEGYKTKNQCGRRINFNNYDLVSCNFSLKKVVIDRTSTLNANQRELQKNQEPDQKLLKTRMKLMQQEVFRKMPFLVQMGVKFKTSRAKS